MLYELLSFRGERVVVQIRKPHYHHHSLPFWVLTTSEESNRLQIPLLFRVRVLFLLSNHRVLLEFL